MKIGIIYYSQSGHTRSVAEQLESSFWKNGCEAEIHEIKIAGEPADKTAPNPTPELTHIPEIDGFDVLIFGSPVQAFSLAAPMNVYLKQLPSLEGKKIACFLTQHLKHAWMGGNRAISQMKKACAAKNGEVALTGIVHWSSPKREEQIKELVDKLCKIK